MKKYILKTIMTFLIIIVFYPLEANSQIIAEDRTFKTSKATTDTGNNFELFDASPVEFKEISNIKFNIFKEGPVKLNVYDSDGKKIATLAEGFMEQGQYSVFFKAFKEIIPGEYFYKLEVNGSEKVKSMILTK